MSQLGLEIAEQVGLLGSALLDSQADGLRHAAALRGAATVVRFVGIGSSRHVAGYAADCFDALTGLPTTVLPAPGAGIPLPRFRSGQLVVMLSQSGQTPALLTVAAAARDAGAMVLALTNTLGSPLDDVADVTLHAGAGLERVVPATKSVTAMMLLLRAFAAPLDPVTLSRLGTSVSQIVKDNHGRLASIAATKELPQIVVCGGAAGQWVADEVALKLAEIVGHLAVPDSLVDFLHGPAAVPACSLAFLDPTDPNAGLVSARDSAVTIGPAADYLLPVPSTGDPWLDAITNVVIGQCLALRWAHARGVDPDDARGLSKVTHTR